MLVNYLKIAWRNIKRQKIYSIINIMGLAVGLTISLVIAFYVYDDVTFDRFHENADSIYRVCMQNNVTQGGRWSAITAGPLLPTSKNELPEVVAATRLILFQGLPIRQAEAEDVVEEQQDAVRGRAMVADADFFEVFSFKILTGDVKDIKKPNAIFMTRELAQSVFGDEDPVGQALQIPNVPDAYVAGLIEAPPGNSHLRFDMFVPLRVELNPVWWDSWENQVLSGYIRLHEAADASDVEAKMDRLAHSNGFPENYDIRLQPLLDVHLKSTGYAYDFRNFGKKDASVVYVMTIIGIMILAVAAVNFINLSSARAAKRAREVGMRKVVGSERSKLIAQFLGESIFITCIAMFIAVMALHIFLPSLEGFLEKRLDINILEDPLLFFLFLGVAIFVGVLSGIYPALILSAFKPINVLRGQFATSRAGVLLRRILVVFQYTITVALIMGVLTVLLQIRYLRTVDLGYNRDQVLGIFNFSRSEDDLLRDRLKQIPSIVSTGRTSRLMGEGLSIQAIPEGSDRSNSLNWWAFYIDDGFFNTLDISMALGRNFSRDITSDAEEGVIINESAQELAGWDNAMGLRIDLVMEEGDAIPRRVIGVVEDFHFTSTRTATGPVVFMFNPQRSPLLIAKLAGGEIVATREQVESIHRELFPDRNVNSFFLDEVFDNQFTDDREFASHLGFFAGVAIFIACLGLVGLVSFAVEQRRKEFAVRKVMGCSEVRVITILVMEFLKWIFVACCIAWPTGYFVMQQWLKEFVYQMPFSVVPFFLSGVGALLVSMITISFQSIQAARTNPAQALRQEA